MVPVMQTHGMGVDSAAWLTAVLRGDMPAGFDIADLTVVTAMTGDESQRTRWAMETFMLPLMRRLRVRYVQVARVGRSESDGIVVLGDTRAPTRMHMRGPERLSEEMFRAGTIPQVSNRHCSYRFKGWVLDRWAAGEYGERPRRHVVGSAAEERRRIERDRTYTSQARTPWYPLADDWGWDRNRCLDYLHSVYESSGHDHAVGVARSRPAPTSPGCGSGGPPNPTRRCRFGADRAVGAGLEPGSARST